MTLSLLLRRFGIARILLLGLLTAFAPSSFGAADGYLINGTSRPDGPNAYCLAGSGYSAGPAYTLDAPDNGTYTGTCTHGYNSPGTFRMVPICNSGAYVLATDSCGVSTPPMTEASPCLGWANLAALAATDGWVREPRTFEYNVRANGIGKITGKTASGKDYSYAVDCTGKGRVTDGDGDKLPAPTPSPAPPVDTAYPKCGVGNYLYTDEAGLSQCSQNLPDRTLADCGSKNGGYVNGKAVCLPANPAPEVAAGAATTAQQKADAALAAGKATAAAMQAANDAAAAYRRAAEAANSMPTSTAAQGSAATAYQSAAQAAIAAGMSVPSPLPNPGTATGAGTGGNGTGTENTGPKECGSPGKPKCQIDETGTPDGKGAMDAADAALKATTTDVQSGLDGAASDAGKSAHLNGWMPVLPAGSCVDPQVRNSGTGGMETVAICDKLPPITLGMELLWAAFFGYAIMALISDAMSKS